MESLHTDLAFSAMAYRVFSCIISQGLGNSYQGSFWYWERVSLKRTSIYMGHYFDNLANNISMKIPAWRTYIMVCLLKVFSLCARRRGQKA